MKKNLLALLLLSFMALNSAFAQSRTISGIVTAEDDGAPLPGVSVKIKGTNLGTQTSGDGKFSIGVTTSQKVLVFSFLGYTVKEVVLTASNSVKVVMKPDAKALNEVVVTSFGIERSKKSLGYATTNIGSESINATEGTNFTNAIAGKVPGVQVTSSGGAFTGSGMLIRGNVTLTGGNQPLIVVDGLPIDNGGGAQALQTGPSASNRGIDINPEDIESTTVLKSAAATVLYGSRAASGAILITLKKGNKSPKNQVEYSGSYTASSPDRLPDLQNTYGQGNNGIYNNAQNTSWGPVIAGQTVTNFFGNPEILTAYPDNLKNFFTTGNTYHNQITFNGGGEKSTFRVSYGNDLDGYFVKNNILKKNNLTANLRSAITDKLTLSSSISYVNNISQRTAQGNSLGSPIFRTYFIPRSYDLEGLPFEDASGIQTWYGAQDNPYWNLEHVKYHDERNRVIGSIDASYALLPWLTADFKLGEDAYGFASTGLDDVGNKGGGSLATSGGVGGILYTNSNARTTDQYFTLSANKKVADFNFGLTIGNEFLDQYSTANNVTGLTLSVPGVENLSNASTYTPVNAVSHTRTFGLFGDLVIDYKTIISINLKARNDLLSTLPVANQNVFYPAIAGSFNLLEAVPSLKSKYLNLIKLRAAYGKVGKGPVAYATTTPYVQGGSSDGFGPTITFPYNSSIVGYGIGGTAGNPNLTPEFTTDQEYGAELGFFNNRLTFDGSYYKRHADHDILNVPVSNASGIGAFTQNAGIIDTKGVEFAITGVPLKYKGGSWTISANFTHNESVVTAIAPGVANIVLAGFTTPYIALVAGQAYGQIYGSAYARDANGNIQVNAAGLPILSPNIAKIGNPNPKYTAGIANTVTYGGFSLYFLLDIRKGGDQYSRNIADVQRNGVAAETAAYPRFVDPTASPLVPTTPYIFQGVYGPNVTGGIAGQPNTTYVSAQNYYGNAGKYVAGEGFIYDTSWLRLREVNFSYSVPKDMLKHTPFGRASVGLYGRNLWFRAPNFPHFDPEQNATGIGNAQGLEFNAYPDTKELGFSLKFSL